MERPFFKLNIKDEIKSKSLFLEKVIRGFTKRSCIKKFIIPLVDNSSIKSRDEEDKVIEYFNSKKFLKN